MLDRLLKIEEQLARAEALLLVVFVLLMLALATYNVLYRNILVPIQVDLLTEDAPASVDESRKAAPVDGSGETPESDGATDDEASGFGGGFGDEGEAGGFGGGFGDDSAAKPSTEGAEDSAEGFGGGFGEEPPPEGPEPAAEPAPADDAAGGFGGGFGDAEPAEAKEPSDDAAGGFGGGFEGGDPAEGFGGGFDSADPDETAPTTNEATGPLVEKEAPWLARVIDSLKLEWIDVLLRQFVLIVGFLGAMLATRRRKHITIDALSKVTPEGVMRWMNVLTNAVSIAICGLLTAAGLDLVEISMEYPTELMSWAEEWHFQLAFPIGFGLLVVHFTIRLIESFYYAMGWAEPRELVKEEGGAI